MRIDRKSKLHVAVPAELGVPARTATLARYTKARPGYRNVRAVRSLMKNVIESPFRNTPSLTHLANSEYGHVTLSTYGRLWLFLAMTVGEKIRGSWSVFGEPSVPGPTFRTRSVFSTSPTYLVFRSYAAAAAQASS